MHIAKVTAKGQITIPIDIRRLLGLDEGSSILFIEQDNGCFMINANDVNINVIGRAKPPQNGWSEEFVKAFLDPNTPPEPLFEEYDDIPWTDRGELF